MSDKPFSVGFITHVAYLVFLFCWFFFNIFAAIIITLIFIGCCLSENHSYKENQNRKYASPSPTSLSTSASSPSPISTLNHDSKNSNFSRKSLLLIEIHQIQFKIEKYQNVQKALKEEYFKSSDVLKAELKCIAFGTPKYEEINGQINKLRDKMTEQDNSIVSEINNLTQKINRLEFRYKNM